MGRLDWLAVIKDASESLVIYIVANGSFIVGHGTAQPAPAPLMLDPALCGLGIEF